MKMSRHVGLIMIVLQGGVTRVQPRGAGILRYKIVEKKIF